MNIGDPRLPERFWAKVEPEPNTGCWLWTASLSSGGYGQFMIRPSPKPERAHRLAYETLVGPIPEGLELDHLCRVRSCCNPSHLEAVTHRENVLRGTSPYASAARKTHCDHGHPLDSTRWKGRKRTIRCCSVCVARQKYEAQIRYRAKHKDDVTAKTRAYNKEYKRRKREEKRCLTSPA